MAESTVLTEREAEEDVCRLLTRGRQSGRPHEIEIWFCSTGPAVYLLSGSGTEADWYRNAMADEHVQVVVGDRRFHGTARPVGRSDERRLVGELMDRKYRTFAGDPEAGFTREQWLWEVPALAVDVERAEPS